MNHSNEFFFPLEPCEKSIAVSLITDTPVIHESKIHHFAAFSSYEFEMLKRLFRLPVMKTHPKLLSWCLLCV